MHSTLQRSDSEQAHRQASAPTSAASHRTSAVSHPTSMKKKVSGLIRILLINAGINACICTHTHARTHTHTHTHTPPCTKLKSANDARSNQASFERREEKKKPRKPQKQTKEARKSPYQSVRTLMFFVCKKKKRKRETLCDLPGENGSKTLSRAALCPLLPASCRFAIGRETLPLPLALRLCVSTLLV